MILVRDGFAAGAFQKVSWRPAGERAFDIMYLEGDNETRREDGMNETAEMVLQLVLAGVLGGLIGGEREYRGKVAGTRTHLLVALGAALMVLVSKHGFGGVGDPGRVAAQIVSGIGFIGAGAIMVDKHAVHGLTTAAGIWVAAGIGMASAAGLYVLAVVTTVLSLIGLEVFGFILFRDRRVARRRGESDKGGNRQGDGVRLLRRGNQSLG